VTQNLFPAAQLPSLVVHFDWSVDRRKRWAARAVLAGKKEYHAYPPQPVGELPAFLPGLKQEASPGGAVLAGFDFPIGLPLAYAQGAGVASFLQLLPRLGSGEWRDFFEAAVQPEEISPHRPFYPARPGSARRDHLVQGLSVNDFRSLRRRCEEDHAFRRAACPLFWTMGGQQVGKAAMSGWKDVLISGLNDSSLKLSLWPFHGNLSSLLQPGACVVVETYPGEFYHHLGLTFPRRRGEPGGKRSQAVRAANAPGLLDWASRSSLRLAPELEHTIRDGFSSSQAGEDQFDAVVGLFGMLNLVLGLRPLYDPQESNLRQIEGWIFGQARKTYP
jgi:hypothetical protein